MGAFGFYPIIDYRVRQVRVTVVVLSAHEPRSRTTLHKSDMLLDDVLCLQCCPSSVGSMHVRTST